MNGTLPSFLPRNQGQMHNPRNLRERGWTQRGCVRGGGGGALKAEALNQAAQSARGEKV